jgi:hypothetical protein
MPRRKLIEFHPETLTSLEQLAADRMANFQELADEAFADLLRKHGRPVGVREALRKSAAANAPAKKRRAGKRPDKSRRR